MSSTFTKKHHVAHHFENADQEFKTCKVGMWAFIVQEVLFFSALFVAYAVFRGFYPDMFEHASSLLNWKLGFINTIVLIFSSYTMVKAVKNGSDKIIMGRSLIKGNIEENLNQVAESIKT